MIDEIRYTNKTDAMAAVIKSGRALKYASEALRADREVVIPAVKQNGLALAHASDVLKADPEVVIAAVPEDIYKNGFRFASEALRANPEVLLVVVRVNGLALQYASEELQGDPDIVMAAVKQNGYALEYASGALRADKSVVLEAMKQNINSMEYAKLNSEDMHWALSLLPAKSAIDNQQEADSKINGCVGMLLHSYEKKQGLIDESVESTDEEFRPYYKDIASYISARDICLFSQLPTNYYVEDVNKEGKLIKRALRRMNFFGTPITKEDREKTVKSFISVDDYPDALRGLSYDRRN